MKKIMLRHANDDFFALLTADAMTEGGGEVFSITNNGPARPHAFSQFREDHERPQKFIVWARVRDAAHMSEIDALIEKKLNAAERIFP